MENKIITKIEKEEIILTEIYKKDGVIGIRYPNTYDILSYEILGFLRCYTTILEESLINQMESDKT